MKLDRIEFGENESGAIPVEVTVTMTVVEAALIAKWVGSVPSAVRQEMIPGFKDPGTDIYLCLVGEVFNRYWDAGVPGFLAGDDC